MKAICLLHSHGFIEFEQKHPHHSVQIHFHLHGFHPHSTHALHIHEFGDLRKGCLSLGGHFNPTHSIHGSLNSHHHHAGDLFNNFTTDPYGQFHQTHSFKSLSLFYDSDFCILGRSIVIHKHPDDKGKQRCWKTNRPYDQLSSKELHSLILQLGYRSKLKSTSMDSMIDLLNQESLLSGNAGQRIDCGIIGLCASAN